MEAGETTTCQKAAEACKEAGGSYNENAIITYERLNNQSFQSAGTVWGNIE
jgi:hypothetical protein